MAFPFFTLLKETLAAAKGRRLMADRGVNARKKWRVAM
jgi:hypothetical protein